MTSDWSSSTFRNALCSMVRKRVPERDVEDVVQSTLVEALSSATKPEEPEAMRKWIWGIARNKVADYHRRAKRETFDVPDVGEEANDVAVNDMLRWAMRELPKEQEDRQTLEWLLREGDGEKLEAIAESAKIPAPRIRQRVSRLRRHLRTRWAADLAALAALGIVGILAIIWWRHTHRDEPIARPDIVQPHELTPFERAADERKRALASCDALAWTDCLDGLDRAKNLDPAGDAAQNVQNARKLATDALNPEQLPTVAPSSLAPIPTSSSSPPSKPAPDRKHPTRPTSTSMPSNPSGP
ncbi:MAG: sigma-70 family RNA polymerase sigma factor [Polyangiaceae bacterium]